MTAALTLAPYAGGREPTDPAHAGEWAGPLSAALAEPAVPPWCAYVARDGSVPVGMGLFKGMPDADGAVEIAYLTFLTERRGGVATATAAALWALARANGAALVRAHTLPEHNASTRVLVANGFVRVGEMDDPDDGRVWRWERRGG